MEIVNEKVVRLTELLANTEKVIVEDLTDGSEFRETCRALVQGLKDEFPEQLEGFNPEALSNDNMFVSTAFQALDVVITHLEAAGEDPEELITARDNLARANEYIQSLEIRQRSHIERIGNLVNETRNKAREIHNLNEQYTTTLAEISEALEIDAGSDKDAIITAIRERDEFTTIEVAGHSFETAEAIVAYIENLEVAHAALQTATDAVTTTQESYKAFKDNSFDGDVPAKVELVNIDDESEFEAVRNAISSMQESLNNHQEALVAAKETKEELTAEVKRNAEQQVDNFLSLKGDIQSVLVRKLEAEKDSILEIHEQLSSDNFDVQTGALDNLIEMISPEAGGNFLLKINAINDFIDAADSSDSLLVRLIENISAFVFEVIQGEEIARLRAENTEYKEGMERIGNAIKGFDPIIAQMQEIIWEFSTEEEQSRLEETDLFTIELDENLVNADAKYIRTNESLKNWRIANDNRLQNMAATGTEGMAFYPTQSRQAPGLGRKALDFTMRHAPGAARTVWETGKNVTNTVGETMKENSEQKKKNAIEVEMRIFREELNISESVQRDINYFLHNGVLEGMSDEDMDTAQELIDELKNTGRKKERGDSKWGRFVNNTWDNFWTNFSRRITQDRARDIYRELVDLCDVNRDERRLNEFFDGAEVDEATQTTINEVFEGNLEELVDEDQEEARTILSKIEISESDETYKFWMKKLCLISDTEMAVPLEAQQMQTWTRESLGIPRNLNYAEKLCDVDDQVYSKVATPTYVANGAFINYENNAMVVSDQQMTIKAIFSGKKGKLFAKAEVNGDTVYIPYYAPLFQGSPTPPRPDQRSAGDYIREKGEVSIARNRDHFQAVMDTLQAEKEALDAILGEEAETEQMTAEVLAKANRVRTLANAAGAAAEEGLAAFTTLAEVRAYLESLADDAE